MFGHDKSDDDNAAQNVAPSTDDATTAPVPDAELTLPTPAGDDAADTSTPAADAASAETTPPVEAPSFAMPAGATSEPSSAGQPITINNSGTLSDLTALKQEALHELSPLIGQLDQTPDEKYATAKMVFEETKDQALLTAVYEAAKNLTDEKAKAEAIYDVIKKINELK